MTTFANNSRLLAQCLRILGHPDRLHIAFTLSQHPATVAELEATTRIAQPYLSQHLASLRKAQLLVATRTARSVTYRLSSGLPENLISALLLADQ
ncbi:helix-turn-helix transcriptional regulator [Pantoea sp. At-9b]|uniref:ArsR/SmtB family transcription factor n=1 Tax=Pantoea sp. (strain At-9b) TaxID=592316 RepID=UPI0001B3F8DB|nr:metalloregulator ArsR/SmtB family transcription factor [Pantoea sp. At-9b]ADU72905.1 transcriptional regulator, ArsR family [Pantoea sp. At-9b]